MHARSVRKSARRASRGVIKPTTIGNFTYYVRGLPLGAEYVARENSTGIEKVARIGDSYGGYYEISSDSRYASITSDVTQGKHGQDDLVAAVFDVIAKDFVRFNVPESSLFHAVSGPANPFWLWVKNSPLATAGNRLRAYQIIFQLFLFDVRHLHQTVLIFLVVAYQI